MSQKSTVAHLDMDAFYASVELLSRPELRELPVAIGGRGDPTRRGVLTTANYVARKYGLRSGMPMRTALKLCPQAIFLPVNFPEYRRISRLFKDALLAICPVMEDRGIDEVYLDLGSDNPDPIATAQELRQAVFVATGLTCSIGIAPNKLLAKIASDLEKPNGLSYIDSTDIERRMWPLPASKVPGIGPKAYARLKEHGFVTMGDVAQTSLADLSQYFTPRFSEWMIRACRGEINSAIQVEQERKSYSRETTFQVDLNNDIDCARVLAHLARRLEKDLKGKQMLAKTIGVKVRNGKFQTFSRDHTLVHPDDSAKRIYQTAWECFDRVPRNFPADTVRLLGIRLTNLSNAGAAAEVGTALYANETQTSQLELSLNTVN